jgi:hypothetical protein
MFRRRSSTSASAASAAKPAPMARYRQAPDHQPESEASRLYAAPKAPPVERLVPLAVVRGAAVLCPLRAACPVAVASVGNRRLCERAVVPAGPPKSAKARYAENVSPGASGTGAMKSPEPPAPGTIGIGFESSSLPLGAVAPALPEPGFPPPAAPALLGAPPPPTAAALLPLPVLTLTDPPLELRPPDVETPAEAPPAEPETPTDGGGGAGGSTTGAGGGGGATTTGGGGAGGSTGGGGTGGGGAGGGSGTLTVGSGGGGGNGTEVATVTPGSGSPATASTAR